MFLCKRFHPLPEIWEGALPRTQLQDIVGGLSAVVEKDLDLGSKAAISQSDVKQHYDNVSLLRVYFWLLQNGCNEALAAASLRQQLLPCIVLCVGQSSAHIGQRTKGAITGSRVAGSLGRIPVQASLRDNLSVLKSHAFEVEDKYFVACTFVDNVIFCGRSVWDATFMGDMFEDYLLERWGQQIKVSSRMVMPTFGNADTRNQFIVEVLFCKCRSLGKSPLAYIFSRQAYRAGDSTSC